MGPNGAQSVPNFFIIRTEQWNTIRRLPADVQIGSMLCNIGESHTILCRHIARNEAITNG